VNVYEPSLTLRLSSSYRAPFTELYNLALNGPPLTVSVWGLTLVMMAALAFPVEPVLDWYLIGTQS
jgi:hypothetical protein